MEVEFITKKGYRRKNDKNSEEVVIINSIDKSIKS